MNQATAIKNFILKNLHQHPSDIVAVASEYFNVTRTTIHRHLKILLKEHKIIKSGTTRNIEYMLTSSLNRSQRYKITPQLSEFTVCTNDFDDIFKRFPENIDDILGYAFTEIFNNAIDHSQGTMILVTTKSHDKKLTLSISDNGIGIFKNITDYFQLDDIRESIIQLNKGKMTTNPSQHSGEGIFFCSRIFDIFEIYANNLYYMRDNSEQDWTLEKQPTKKSGTTVVMTLAEDSNKNLVALFKKYREPESLAFDRTEITVELAKFKEERLISRSQAKRILLGLEKFHQVTLDFSKVRLVGQGFIDEVFRVFTNQHPHVKFQIINANENVEFMIKRGINTQR